MTSNLEKHRIQRLCELRHEFLEESASDNLVCFLHVPPFEAFIGAPVLGQINLPQIDLFLDEFKLVVDPATPESNARSIADRWMWGAGAFWRPCNVIVVHAEDAYRAATTGKVSSESQHEVHALVIKFQTLMKQVGVACTTPAFRELNPFDRNSTLCPLYRGCDLLSLMFWSAPPCWMHNSAFNFGRFDVFFWEICPFVEAAKTIERCLLTEEHPQVFPEGIEWPVWAGHRPATPTKWAAEAATCMTEPPPLGDEQSPLKVMIGEDGQRIRQQSDTAHLAHQEPTVSQKPSGDQPAFVDKLETLTLGVLEPFFDRAPPQQIEIFKYLLGQPNMKATKRQLSSACWRDTPSDSAYDKACQRLAEHLQDDAPRSGWSCIRFKSSLKLVVDENRTDLGLK